MWIDPLIMSLSKISLETKKIINDMYKNSNKSKIKLTENQKDDALQNFHDYIVLCNLLEKKERERTFYYTITALKGRGSSITICYSCGLICTIENHMEGHFFVETNWLSFFATFVENKYFLEELKQMKNNQQYYKLST